MRTVIAHIGDTHFSKRTMLELYGANGAVINAIYRGLSVCKPDIIVHTGDVFDKAEFLNSAPVLRTKEFFRTVRKFCDNVFVVPGTRSHDPPDSLHILEGIADVVGYSPRITDTTKTIGVKSGYISVGNVFIVFLPAVSLAELEASRKSSVAVLHELSQVAASHGGDMIKILCTHGTIAESFNEHGVPMDGADWEFRLNDFEECHFDLVMLGHIHAHQMWCLKCANSVTGSVIIEYAGSVGRFTIGESNAKYMPIITIDGARVYCSTISLPASESKSFSINERAQVDAVITWMNEDERRTAKITTELREIYDFILSGGIPANVLRRVKIEYIRQSTDIASPARLINTSDNNIFKEFMKASMRDDPGLEKLFELAMRGESPEMLANSSLAEV